MPTISSAIFRFVLETMEEQNEATRPRFVLLRVFEKGKKRNLTFFIVLCYHNVNETGTKRQKAQNGLFVLLVLCPTGIGLISHALIFN